ncbi:MAG: hypothetical protein WDO18_11805 [Acidobacteriota bacterium]
MPNSRPPAAWVSRISKFSATAEQILIGSPATLAVEYGPFSHDKLREQATKAGFTRRLYKNAELWISPAPDAMSVAYISERVLLVAKAGTLEDAVARVSDPKNRSYSPLLARGSRYSKEDLWVVATRLPDPLASSFVPFAWEATAFEGSVSVWDGLHAVAAVERASPTRAMDLADSIAESLASRPALAEGTEITTHERSVLIRMDLDEDQLAESLRPADPNAAVAIAAAPAPPPPIPAPNPAPTPISAAKPQARAFVAPAPAPPTARVTTVVALPEVDVRSDVAQTAGGSPQASLPAAPPRPLTIKIIGLPEGTREIPLGR